MTELVDVALAVAKRYPVFPLSAEKTPLKDTRGFHDATQDPEVIRREFSRSNASLVGVPTGAASGLFVVDIDPNGRQWLSEHDATMPDTRTHSTRRGTHVLFKMPAERVGCSRSKIAKGVDVRAEGGYIVWWPAAGLPFESGDIADPPSWLIEAARASSGPSSAPQNPDDPFLRLRPVTGVPIERATQLLAYLNVDDYDEWLGAGMALRHEYGDAGFETWHTWTQSSDQYRPDNGPEFCRYKWDSFGRQPGAPMTLRTLINRAKARGAPKELWTDPPKSSNVDVMALVGQVDREVRRRFKLVNAVQFADCPPPSWLVRGVIPRAELGMIYAESTAGKSFVAVDLSLHMAAGLPWRGFKTKSAAGLYIAAEGASGLAIRLRAAAKQLGLFERLGELPLHLMPDVPNFLDPEQMADLIGQVRELGRLDFIFVDTTAQVTAGGDENSGEDMGRALAHCRALHAATGAVVILIHHAGKDLSRGARGWSGIKAACDFELAIIRIGDAREIHVTKQKDGRDSAIYPFELADAKADLIDEDGQAVSSCYVKHIAPETAIQATAAPRKSRDEGADKGLGRWQRAVMNAARDLCAMLGECTENELVEVASHKYPAPRAGVRDRRREGAEQAVSDLVERGRLARDGVKVKIL